MSGVCRGLNWINKQSCKGDVTHTMSKKYVQVQGWAAAVVEEDYIQKKSLAV